MSSSVSNIQDETPGEIVQIPNLKQVQVSTILVSGRPASSKGPERAIRECTRWDSPRSKFMHLGKGLGIAVIVTCSLCASAHNAHGQGGGQNPAGAALQNVHPVGNNKEDKEAEKKEGNKKEDEDGQKKELQKKDRSQTPAGIEWANTILDKLMSWVLVALVFLILFRAKLAALLDSVTDAMSERGVTLEVSKVKIQVSERAQDVYEDRGTSFLVSPFDLEPDPYEGFADTLEMPPQLTFQVSDSAASWWITHEHGHDNEFVEADRKFQELNDKIDKATRFEDVMEELVGFSRALEKVRFINATRLKNPLEGNPGVRDALVTLAKRAPSTPEEQMALHAAGVAYVQSAVWSTARSLLEPIAWINGQPGYLPAADAWLAARYHDGIETARSPGPNATPDAFLKALLSTADDVVAKAESVLEEMRRRTGWSPTPGNVAYYLREVNKVLGTVSAFRADYSEPPEKSKEYLQRALGAYSTCIANIAGEGPSPLDHNNLADTYRQLGRFDKSQYAKAHEESQKALACSAVDPTFVNTEACIFIDEKKPVEALNVLTAVPPEKMAKASQQDLEQYIDNQILAAKVAAGTGRPQVVRLSQAADILEAAARFLDDKAAQLDDEAEQARLTAELNELLGFTYLGLPGYERRSVECYERLAPLWDKVSATAEVRWRRRLGGVRAYTRLARVSRRNFDYGTAANQRQRGRRVVNDNLGELEAFRVEKGQLGTLLLRQARVKLDTAMALQGLAEESFHGGELGDAKELLDKEDNILAALRDFREHEAIGAKIRLACGLSGLLRGWLAFHSDPGTYEPAVLTDIEKNLLAARGHGAVLDCQVDLALGEVFLAAALAGKAGDAAINYRKAIYALEFAVGREAPVLRADATRALMDAYAKRVVVQRRAKESKRA